MAEKTTCISQQQTKPIKILKWKVSEGNTVSIGRVLVLYHFDGAPKEEQRKLKVTQAGTVHKILAQEGAILKPGELLCELKECTHPTVMNDMCGECGTDLRKNDVTVAASVPMVHAIPDLKVSEELAQKLGKADVDRLIKDRKLVLLVDLDQTLIHTTNDNIQPNIKDVYHFQLYGPNSPWYYTRLRPGTHQFLNNIYPLFELHICTFGARNYAHMIAAFLDRDQRFFSNRILSRDECFDPTSKKANLKALFPCGDNMVCIIDDREDVWSNASNLIHVKPYHFFQHTGDINAPPGLDKHENDNKLGVDLSKIKDTKKDQSKVNNEQIKVSDNNENPVVEEFKKDTVTSNGKNNDTDVESEIKDTKDGLNGETTDGVKGSNEKVSSENCQPQEECKEEEGSKDERNDRVQEEGSNEIQNQSTEKDQDQSAVKGQEESTDNGKEQITDNGQEQSTDNGQEQSTETGEEQSTGKGQEQSTGKGQEQSTDNGQEQSTDKGQEQSTDNGQDQNGEKIQEQHNARPPENNLIEIEDPDDYLLHLEDILKSIHQAFYEDYDRMESGEVPDLKKVIPRVRGRVLNGCKLVFSGLVPTHIKLEQSKAYQIAKSLGAQVTQELEEDTTHLVAVRPGTAKVNAGRRKKNLKIVTPDWLWSCAERWEHVNEKIFALNSKGSKNRHPPPHCSSPEHIINYPEHNTPAMRKRTPSGRFMDTINPLMSFSSADIADMDKEVEDILDDESDTSEDEAAAKVPAVINKQNTTSSASSSSSSEDSLTAEYPKGYKRKREETDNGNDRSNNSTEDDSPSIKFQRGEVVDSELDLEPDSQESEASVDAPDEVDDGEWNMMGAALEREFLSNN